MAEHKPSLEYVASEEFMNDSNVTKVDSIRNELRELLRFIDPSAFEPIITDFKDEITSKDILPYLRDIRYFIANGHECQFKCEGECRYCDEKAREMEKFMRMSIRFII